MTLMNIRHTIIRLFTLSVVIASIAADALAANESLHRRYNEKNPVTVAFDMEFPPFEYRNDNGEPDGFNVGVVELIMEKLQLPVYYKMGEWKTVINDLKKGKADLMLSASFQANEPGLHYSRLSVTPYKIGVAYKKGGKPAVKVSDIPANAKVVVKRGDYCGVELLKMGLSPKQLYYETPKMALYGVDKGNYDYFLYCEQPLRWNIREYGLTMTVDVATFDIPGTQFRFISHDQELLNEIDDQFTRLQQSGELNKLQKKWLISDDDEGFDDTDVGMLAVVIIAIAAFFIVVNTLVARRVKRGIQETLELNRLLTEALNGSHNNVISYNLKSGILKNVNGDWLPESGMTDDVFYGRVHPDDKAQLAPIFERKNDNISVGDSYNYRWNVGNQYNPQWRLFLNRMVPEFDHKGHIVNIYSTVTDVTDQQATEKRETDLAYKFAQMFQHSLVGFALYDAEGNFIEANAKFGEVLHFETQANMLFYKTTNLYNLDSVREAVTDKSPIHIALCFRTILYGSRDFEYFELQLRPIVDNDGNFVFNMVTIKNIDNERNNVLQSRKSDIEIRRINRKIQQYEKELRYLLESSHMHVWSTSIADGEVRFFKDLRSYEAKMPITTFIDKIANDADKEKGRQLTDSVYNKRQSVTAMIAVKDLFEVGQGVRYYSVNSIPNYDSEGKLIGCFGLIRDVTQMMESQEKLRQETIRANESDQQKSAFLANMSHEIRTPLNAIVGFCDLLQSIDDPDEKKEFMRIIRNNCDMLLMLIDDILVLSTIDSGSESLKMRDLDFAPAFDDMCTSLAQRVADKPTITFLTDNPCEHLYTRLDKDRIHQVITNFVTNAVKNTQQGHIKVGYNVVDGGLRVYCEDTGCGIPQDKCDQIFQRFVKLNDFVQGAGLGLSICKKICEMYGGRIGVDSKVGEGSTFWMWVPCEIKEH